MGASIVSTLTTAISGLASGIAETVTTIFDSVFVSGEGLSNIAIWGLCFLAVSFVIGLVSKFTSKAG